MSVPPVGRIGYTIGYDRILFKEASTSLLTNRSSVRKLVSFNCSCTPCHRQHGVELPFGQDQRLVTDQVVPSKEVGQDNPSRNPQSLNGLSPGISDGPVAEGLIRQTTGPQPGPRPLPPGGPQLLFAEQSRPRGGGLPCRGRSCTRGQRPLESLLLG